MSTASPSHRRGAAVQGAVLDATVQLLAARGYEFSVEEVAATAGVHKTTVYRKWSTKAALVAAAVERLAHEHVVLRRTDDPLDDLVELAASVGAVLRRPEGVRTIRAVVAAVAHDAELEHVARSFFDARYEIAAEIVRAAVASGRVSAQVDPVLLWQAIVNPLHMRALLGEPASDADARQLVRLVLDGAST